MNKILLKILFFSLQIFIIFIVAYFYIKNNNISFDVINKLKKENYSSYVEFNFNNNLNFGFILDDKDNISEIVYSSIDSYLIYEIKNEILHKKVNSSLININNLLKNNFVNITSIKITSFDNKDNYILDVNNIFKESNNTIEISDINLLKEKYKINGSNEFDILRNLSFLSKNFSDLFRYNNFKKYADNIHLSIIKNNGNIDIYNINYDNYFINKNSYFNYIDKKYISYIEYNFNNKKIGFCYFGDILNYKKGDCNEKN